MGVGEATWSGRVVAQSEEFNFYSLRLYFYWYFNPLLQNLESYKEVEKEANKTKKQEKIIQNNKP